MFWQTNIPTPTWQGYLVGILTKKINEFQFFISRVITLLNFNTMRRELRSYLVLVLETSANKTCEIQYTSLNLIPKCEIILISHVKFQINDETTGQNYGIIRPSLCYRRNVSSQTFVSTMGSDRHTAQSLQAASPIPMHSVCGLIACVPCKIYHGF